MGNYDIDGFQKVVNQEAEVIKSEEKEKEVQPEVNENLEEATESDVQLTELEEPEIGPIETVRRGLVGSVPLGRLIGIALAVPYQSDRLIIQQNALDLLVSFEEERKSIQSRRESIGLGETYEEKALATGSQRCSILAYVLEEFEESLKES